MKTGRMSKFNTINALCIDRCQLTENQRQYNCQRFIETNNITIIGVVLKVSASCHLAVTGLMIRHKKAFSTLHFS